MQMTITQSIIEWLKLNDVVLDHVGVDMLPNGVQEYAMMKSPTNQIEYFNDGSQMRTEYYNLFARRETQFDEDRDKNSEFFEDLEYKVADLNALGNLPILDKGRYCDNIAVSGASYLFQTQENESIYSLTFEIKYRKELSNTN